MSDEIQSAAREGIAIASEAVADSVLPTELKFDSGLHLFEGVPAERTSDEGLDEHARQPTGSVLVAFSREQFGESESLDALYGQIGFGAEQSWIIKDYRADAFFVTLTLNQVRNNSL